MVYWLSMSYWVSAVGTQSRFSNKLPRTLRYSCVYVIDPFGVRRDGRGYCFLMKNLYGLRISDSLLNDGWLIIIDNFYISPFFKNYLIQRLMDLCGILKKKKKHL